MLEYVPPLFLFELRSLESIYKNAEKLSLKVEPIDVDDDIYEVYDAVGNPFSFKVRSIEKRNIFGFIYSHEEVYLVPGTQTSMSQKELRKYVLEAFTDTAISKESLENSSFEEILVLIDKYIH